MIALIIKGSPADSRVAMAKRGIEWNDSSVSMFNNRETLARCSSDSLAKVQAWLAEDTRAGWQSKDGTYGALVGGEFPAGTLLWYKSLEVDAADRASLEASAKHQPQSRDEVIS